MRLIWNLVSIELLNKKYMKISDYIAKSIMKYPSLYKSVDYEQSKLKVLNYIFFVSASEVADTGDESTGGYVVEPRYMEDINGDYIRLKDEPYGLETHPELPEDYFQTKIYETRDYGVIEQFSKYQFKPYPFSKGFSLACDVYYEDVKLQQDWMVELVFLCKETLKFFNSDEDVKRDVYHPDNKNGCGATIEFFTKYRETQLDFLNAFLEKFDN